MEVTPSRDIEELGRALGLSADDLALALNTHSPEAPQHVVALRDLCHALLDTFKTPDAARAWLHTPSRYLAGLAPADAIRVDGFDRVEAALEALDSGVFV